MAGTVSKLLRGRYKYWGGEIPKFQLGIVADPVIEAIARLEFEDGLRTGVLPGGCWYPCSGRT